MAARPTRPTPEQKRIAQRDTHIRLANLCKQQGEMIDAYEYMTIALENDPQCAECYALRGEVAMKMDYLPLAAENYQQACLLAPDSILYHIEYARALMHLNQPDSAAAQLDHILRLDPNELEAERLTALNYFLQNDYTRAIDAHLAYMHHYMQLEHEAPEMEDMLFAIPDSAACQYLLHRLDSAVQHSEGDMQSMYQVAHTKALYQVVGTQLIGYYRAGQWQQAQTCIERLMKAEPTDFSLYLLRGQCAFEQEQFAQSERDWLWAGTVDETHAPMAFHLLGCQYYYLKRYEEAIETLDESIRHDHTKNPHAYLFRALSYLAIGDTLVANEDFETILEEDTSYYNSVRQFALLYLGEREEAETWQEQLLQTDPQSEMFFSAACFYALLGKENKAQEMLQLALDLGYPSRVSILYSPELQRLRAKDEGTNDEKANE